MPTSPPVFLADDYREYVLAWLAHRPRLSQRWLAKRAGVSPALLSMVLSGDRTPKLESIASWSQAMSLDEEEASHFEALVHQEHAPTESLRDAARRRVRTHADFYRASQLTADIRWLGSWLHLTLLEAARASDFDADPVALAAVIWPRTSAEAIENALADLQSDGVLERTDNGWRTDLRPLRTAAQVESGRMSEHAQSLHRDQLLQAREALDAFPSHQRTVASVTVAVAESRVAELLAAAHEIPLQLAAEHADDEPERVVELILAAYPHTTSG